MSVLVTVAWTVAAAVMAGRGLDVTDEGFYLLSYRWWDSNPASFTGVQYIWGPVFAALNHDVAMLREFRLVAILLTHLALGMAASRWLAALQGVPGSSSGPGRTVIVLTVLATGGLVQGWGPLSPGYNDTGLLMTLLLVAACLSLHAAALTGRRPGWVWPAASGPVVLGLALAKWSTALLVVPFLAVALLAAYPRGRRKDLLPIGAGLVLSLAVSAWLFHVLVASWPALVGGLLPVIRSISGSTNSPSSLVAVYATSSVRVALVALVSVLLTSGLVVAVRRANPKVHSAAIGAAPGLALLLTAGLAGGFVGGVGGVFWYTSALVAISIVTWFLASQPSDGSARGSGLVPMVTLLVLVPGVQAAGTGNPLYFLAVGSGSTWVVLLLLLWSRANSPQPARAAAAGVATCLVVVAWVGTTGPLLAPYRSTPVNGAAEEFESGSTGRLALDPGLVDTVDQLRPVIGPVGTPVMAFDEMAGLVLLLDGRSVGEAWYSQADPERTAAGIIRYCEDSRSLWADGLPVIVSDRELGPTEYEALTACGLDTTADFRPMRVMGTYDLNVLVPREPAGG
jgi:hypothetical protein